VDRGSANSISRELLSHGSPTCSTLAEQKTWITELNRYSTAKVPGH
jgi:hypothetical protein